MTFIKIAAAAALVAGVAGAASAQVQCVPQPTAKCTDRFPSGPVLSYVGPSGGNMYCTGPTAGTVQTDVYTVAGSAGYNCTYILPCQVYPPNSPIYTTFCQ